jgi:ParB-like nuclease family protein
MTPALTLTINEETMDNLSSLLSPIKLRLNDLLLDPNNPRFSELGDVLNPIPEGRFADEKVQANTFEKMKDPLFDVAELRDTIKTIGFLPMDRIVVRPWKGSGSAQKFVVIEGNRRVTALRWLAASTQTFWRRDKRILRLRQSSASAVDNGIRLASLPIVPP